ncbi:MAG: ATP-binding protein [Gemmataceae bacterium]
MASRWRIRHKLIITFCLSAGIVTLLLLGTLKGFWSYYQTMNSIRSDLGELKTAQELREILAQLAAPGKLEHLLDEPEKLSREVNSARQKILEYEVLLQETNARLFTKLPDHYERGMLADLNRELDAFQGAALKFHEPMVRGPGENPTVDPRLKSIRQQLAKMELNSTQLRDKIHDDLAGSLNESRRAYQVSLWIIVPSCGIGLLLLAGVLYSFYGWIFYPIRDLEAGVSQVARGDFNHRIEVKSGDEMEALGEAFNHMTSRLRDLYTDLARQVNERSRQLVRSERLASVGFLAAGVAHEINNPLAGIAFCSEALESRLKDLRGVAQKLTREQEPGVLEDFAKYLKLIQDEAFRCKNITEKLLDFSRTGEKKREPVNLSKLVHAVLDVTKHLQNSKGKTIQIAEEAPIQAWINGEEIRSVVLNLVVNGLDSMDEGGKLTIRLREVDNRAELRFQDSGCGMSQEVLENIFEPFFTMNRTGKGTGLGLTISHRIIQQHGGEIEATSEGQGKGSCFIVRLPLHPASHQGYTTQDNSRENPPRVMALSA